MKIQIAFYSII